MRRPDVEIRPERLDSPVARELIAALNEELSRDYPPEDRFHELPAEDVMEGRGSFVVIWRDGAAIGCGAVRLISDSVAELKRMYIEPASRGQGLSRALIAVLEARALAIGASRIVLETGQQQLAALALYERGGYRRIPCFGAYAASKTSVCYEKHLDA